MDDDDEQADTLTKDSEAQGGDDGQSRGSLADAAPGMADILGANLRGELYELGPGRVIADKWDLLKLLGEGSFGKVYEARHIKLGHRVAIKVLVGKRATPKARQLFLEEAQLMAAMSSEHLIRASDYGELPDGSPYFVMDLVKGRSLRHLLERRLDLGRAMEVGEQILTGLVEVHKRGVVHGDIKPENVVIGEDDDKARLLDFGLAQTSATEPEELGGTPHYMAPEMLLDREPASMRSDVYAVGAVLYEMLTGMLPRGHLGMDVSKIRAEWKIRRKADPLLMHCRDVPEQHRTTLEALDRLVMEALTPEPIARPKSAVPMLEELRRLRKRLLPEALAPTLTAQTVTTSSADTEEKTSGSRQPEREPRPVVLPRWLLVLVVIAIVGAGWWAWPTEDQGKPTQDGAQETSERRTSGTAEGGAPFGAKDLEAARGGILIAVADNASEPSIQGHDALCSALGGARPTVEGALPVHCRIVPAVGSRALRALAEEAGARVVVHVGDGKSEEVEVWSTSHDRGNPLLARLDGLPLPRDPKGMAQVAPVLRAVVGANTASKKTGASHSEIGVLDWERVGARWGVLAEWLRLQQGHEAREDIDRRKQLVDALEGMLAAERERGEDRGAAYYRDLAMLVWASSLRCVGSEPMLVGLSVAGEHHDGIRGAALLERVVCLLERDDAASRAQEAETLLREAFAASGDNACMVVSTMGSISWIDRWKGDDALWEANAGRLPGLEACESRTWSRGYAVRGDALVDRERWCEAAEAYALAYGARQTEVEPLLNWAEYAWKCDPKRGTPRPRLLDALREALVVETFPRPQQRVSLAYLLWWHSRESDDAQRVLDEYAKVNEGEAALIEGVASDLEAEICAGMREETCSRRILARAKQAGGAERLRNSLGLR